MIVIDGIKYKAMSAADPGSCEGCAGRHDNGLCVALPDCIRTAAGSVVYVHAETPQQTYNRVMQEDNV